jgi:hypothetical protein
MLLDVITECWLPRCWSAGLYVCPFALLPVLTATYFDFDSYVRLHIPRVAFKVGGLDPLRIWELCREVNLHHHQDSMGDNASTSTPFFCILYRYRYKEEPHLEVG